MSDKPVPEPVSRSQILFYQSEDGTSRIEVRLEEGTVWLTQALIAELYQTTKQNVSLNIRNILIDRRTLSSRNGKGILDSSKRRISDGSKKN